MGMGEISRPQITGKGATKWCGSEILPEPGVKAPGIEARAAFRIETHSELSTVDQGKAGTRSRHLSPRAHELEPGVDQFQGDEIHGIQLVPTRCE